MPRVIGPQTGAPHAAPTQYLARPVRCGPIGKRVFLMQPPVREPRGLVERFLDRGAGLGSTQVT